MATAADGSTAVTQPSENVTYVALSELKELCSKALSTLGYHDHEIAVLNDVSGSLGLGDASQ